MGNWKTREQEMARSAADGERGGACGFHFRYETISADGKSAIPNSGSLDSLLGLTHLRQHILIQ